jgi:hypothetical protein
MSCDRDRNTLTGIAAGAPASAEIVHHLGDCAHCRSELQALRRALGLAEETLRELLSVEPGPELAVRIRRAASSAVPAQPAVSRVWATAAAAVILVAAVAGWLGIRPWTGSLSLGSPQARGADGLQADRQEPGPSGRGVAEATAAGAARAAQPSRARITQRLRNRRDPVARQQPEVLVPPGEAAVLLRFAAELQRRRVSPDSLLVADPRAPLSPPRDIDMVTLDLVTLDTVALGSSHTPGS